MKVLNIHGYKGGSENTACSVLKNMGFEVISPQLNYNDMSPQETLNTLRNYLNGCDAIVGTSLGGFFGILLSVEFNTPVILVNPCLMPFLTLTRLGFTGEIQPYIELFPEITKIDLSLESTIIGGKDNIIDYHDMTKRLLNNERFRIFPEGRHSGATLPLENYFDEIFSQYINIKNVK